MSLVSIGFAAAEQDAELTEVPSREDEAAYHRRRAEEELIIAEQTELPEARRFHYHLAALHLDRAHSGKIALKQVA